MSDGGLDLTKQAWRVTFVRNGEKVLVFVPETLLKTHKVVPSGPAVYDIAKAWLEHVEKRMTLVPGSVLVVGGE